MGKNDITGDSIITGPTSQEYLDGYDRIFKKPISSEEEETNQTSDSASNSSPGERVQQTQE